MGNSVLPFRHRLSCHITCLSNVILCKLILFSVKLNIVTYQNKYLQFNLYPKLYRQVAERKENIGCKCATLGGLLFNLAFYVYKAYIFSVPRCSNGLNSSLKESDFDQSILETNVPNERIAFLGFTWLRRNFHFHSHTRLLLWFRLCLFFHLFRSVHSLLCFLWKKDGHTCPPSPWLFSRFIF